MTRGDFEAGLPTNVTMWNGGANGVNYEQEFKNDLNQLTLLKLNQVTDQLTKEGYVIDDKQELILR